MKELHHLGGIRTDALPAIQIRTAVAPFFSCRGNGFPLVVESFGSCGIYVRRYKRTIQI